MSKQLEIPTTAVVPPFPNEKGVERDEWSKAVAGFCRGAQGVKTTTLDQENNDYTKALRVGNLVFVQGYVTVNGGYLLNNKVLPVIPRENGFLQAFSSAGEVRGIPYSTGSKEVNVEDMEDGTYYISGTYIAGIK